MIRDRITMTVPVDWKKALEQLVRGAGVTFGGFMEGAVEGYVKQTYEQTKGYIDAINAGAITGDDEKALETLKASLQGQLDLYEPFYKAFCQTEEAEPSPEDAKPKKKGR